MRGKRIIKMRMSKRIIKMRMRHEKGKFTVYSHEVHTLLILGSDICKREKIETPTTTRFAEINGDSTKL